MPAHNFRETLKAELFRRKRVNPRYSLRAFARDLRILPSRLSDIIGGKQGLSEEVVDKLIQRLPLSDREKTLFKLDVLRKHARSQKKKDEAQAKFEELKKIKISRLSIEKFKIISDWYHFALRELTTITDAPQTVSAMAKRLNLSESITKKAINRLKELGMITNKDGRYVNCQKVIISSPDEIPSDLIKKFHSSILDQSKISLYTDPLEDRNFRTLIISIDESKIPEAKDLMLEYTQKIHALLNQSEKKGRVYAFSTLLFPLDKK